jgi:phage shock protein A
MERSSSPNLATQEENKTNTTEKRTALRELQSELENCKNEISLLLKKVQQLELEKNELNKLLQDTKNRYEAQISTLTKQSEDLAKQLAESSMHCDTLLNLV